MDMQYLAYRVNGDGTEDMLDPDLPLSGVRVTREKNGIGRLTASLPPEYEMERSDGIKVIREWSTAIYVQIDGLAFDGFLVVETESDNETLELDCVGWIGYGADQPWPDRSRSFNKGNVKVSEVIDRIWDEVQRYSTSNIGLDTDLGSGWPRIGNPIYEELPNPKPPGRIEAQDPGKQPKAPSYGKDKGKYQLGRADYDEAMKRWRKRKDAYDKAKREYEERKRKYEQDKKDRAKAIDDAKIKMNYWSTHDLLRFFQQLADEVGFSYRVDHQRYGSNFIHTLRCRMGMLGRRHRSYSLIEGENVMTAPKITRGGDEKVTSAVILGAGEGSKMRWLQKTSTHGTGDGLRRAKVFADKTLTRNSQLMARAQEVLAEYGDPVDIEEFDVIDHGLSPVTAIDVGDEIRLMTNDRRGRDEDTWVSIEAISLEPEKQRFTLAVREITEYTILDQPGTSGRPITKIPPVLDLH